MNIKHLRTHVVRPVLHYNEMWSEAAENLVIGTGMQESGFEHLVQLNDGPALGFYQMEPATHDDIWANYLVYRSMINVRVTRYLVKGFPKLPQLVWNLAYATIMCRIHYLRQPGALPDAEDAEGMAKYWKKYYNTEQGRGTEEEFMENFKKIFV